MLTVTARIACPPEACYRAFVDPALWTAWVPGLRRARVIALDADGRPQEVAFEFAASLTYSLTYTYEPARHAVAWEPRAGKRDAVRGRAHFAPAPDGSLLHYELAQGDGRSAAEQVLADPDRLVAAFAAFMARRPR